MPNSLVIPLQRLVPPRTRLRSAVKRLVSIKTITFQYQKLLISNIVCLSLGYPLWSFQFRHHSGKRGSANRLVIRIKIYDLLRLIRVTSSWEYYYYRKLEMKYLRQPPRVTVLNPLIWSSILCFFQFSNKYLSMIQMSLGEASGGSHWDVVSASITEIIGSVCESYTNHELHNKSETFRLPKMTVGQSLRYFLCNLSENRW